MILRALVIGLFVLGIVLVLRRKRSPKSAEPLTLQPYEGRSGGPGGSGTGDRSPLSPMPPVLSGEAAKRLGDDDVPEEDSPAVSTPVEGVS
jgi:hypothetical protein